MMLLAGEKARPIDFRRQMLGTRRFAICQQRFMAFAVVAA